jgi:hypothetical protein
METFIPAQPDSPNINRVEKLIKKFNALITARLSGVSNETGGYSLNTALDNVPELTGEEFDIASREATAQGYSLGEHEDNYNSITYTLNKL